MFGRKSILLLMNGFGMEVPKSFNVYTAALMPSLAKLSNHYPFTSVFASGTEVGLNKGQMSSFREGYNVFSSMGKPVKKSHIVKDSVYHSQFDTNPVIVNAIRHALKHNSHLHVLFSIGERTEKEQFEQLRRFCELAIASGVEEVRLHIFLGENSVTGMKVSAKWIKNLKSYVLYRLDKVKLVSVAGRKYLTDAPKDEKIAYYRMVVSGVGEIWANYEETIEKKYAAKENDDNMGGFLTIREPVIKQDDSVMNFNYDNNVGAEYIDIIQHPEEFFPAGKVPKNIAVNALFEIMDNPNIPYAFESELPEHYFFENLPLDKKILIIADSDRVQYISKCLNGFRDNYNPNINIWPIEDKKKRFELMAQYLGAYINQDVYDLIIADCDLFNEKYDKRTVDQLRTNMKALDTVLNVAYIRGMEKNYTLYVTSFYGIKTQLTLTTTQESIDFSQKTPLMIAGNDITRANTALQRDGNFTQIAPVLRQNLGMDIKTTLVGAKTKGAKNKKLMLIVIVAVAALAILFIVYYLYMQGII